MRVEGLRPSYGRWAAHSLHRHRSCRWPRQGDVDGVTACYHNGIDRTTCDELVIGIDIELVM